MSPEGGFWKISSTPASSAAFLAPASAMLQNASGLLLTKATRGLPEPDEQPRDAARQTQAQAARRRQWRGFMVRLDSRGAARGSAFTAQDMRKRHNDKSLRRQGR